MTLICKILIVVNASGLPWAIKADVEGKLLKESESNYLVDFSNGLKDFKLVGKPDDYKKVLVERNKCVKL